MSMRRWTVAVGLSLFVFLVGRPALADTSRAIFAFSSSGVLSDTQLILDGTPVDASFTGWYDQTGSHDSTNPNYIAGVCGSSDSCLGDDLNRRDFFVFDVPPGLYTSAVLSLFNPSVGYISTNPTETYDSWDVSTLIFDLEANNTGRVDIFNDLGSGMQFGSVVVSAADNGTFVNITLNSDALVAINSAEGGPLAIGGAVELGAPVPEPATLLLFGSGCGLLASLMRRRKKSA